LVLLNRGYWIVVAAWSIIFWHIRGLKGVSMQIVDIVIDSLIIELD
jgi:hypothetical protein